MPEDQQPTAQIVEQISWEFQRRLSYPRNKGPKQQFGIFGGGFPGSGKTVVAKKFAEEAGNCFHVQANDARVLLTEMGGYKWGANVRAVLKDVLTELCAGGHSFILDGAFIEESDASLRSGLIQKFSLKPLLVAVNCPINLAETRARRRYVDGRPSTFGDWRAMTDGKPDVEKHITGMGERKDELEHLLELNHDIRVINNHGTKDELDWQVRKIWREFNAI